MVNVSFVIFESYKFKQIYSRDGVGSHFVSPPVHLLDGRVVGVFVRHEERSLNLTSVRIVSALLEDFVVEINVVIVNGVIEGDCHHLRHRVWFKFAGNLRAVNGTEAVGQNTLGLIAGRRAVGILVDGAGVLIGAIRAIRSAVTELLLLDTVAVTAGQLARLTDRLIGGEQRRYETWLFKLLTILNIRLPIAGLLLNVERQS